MDAEHLSRQLRNTTEFCEVWTYNPPIWHLMTAMCLLGLSDCGGSLRLLTFRFQPERKIILRKVRGKASRGAGNKARAGVAAGGAVHKITKTIKPSADFIFLTEL